VPDPTTVPPPGVRCNAAPSANTPGPPWFWTTCRREVDQSLRQPLTVANGSGQVSLSRWVALTIAAGAALVAIGAYALNHRRTTRDVRTSVGPLEISATLVAIVSGVVGLAAQFIPGVGAHESPPAQAHLAVREVLARITRGEYAEKTGAGRAGIQPIDLREVGQVFWLEVGLKGYRDKKPQLQYALYDPDRGGSLLVGTGTTVGLKV
jgi:hypothetical protein